MDKLNIHQKLLEVRKSLKGLSKDAKNEHQRFKYVSSSNVLAALREEMNNQGLLLIPSVESSEVRNHETKAGVNWFYTILNLVYTWVNVDDPKDTVVCKWIGCGLDSSELGVGKAVTYGEKYFLLKFFNLPTDGDDPDGYKKGEVAPPTTEQIEAAIKEVGAQTTLAGLETVWNTHKGLQKNKDFKAAVTQIKANINDVKEKA